LGVMHRGKARGQKANCALLYLGMYIVGLLASEAFGNQKAGKRGGFGAIRDQGLTCKAGGPG
jgi:hypothetical protein